VSIRPGHLCGQADHGLGREPVVGADRGDPQQGDARSSQLLREIQGISRKMLTQTLRGLERDGLVSRRVYSEVPVRVEYALTDTGRTLLEPLIALQAWSLSTIPELLCPKRATTCATGDG
jgi:DNA-binding HxlR family transcriptional regulator